MKNKIPTAEEFLRSFKHKIGLRSQSAPLGSEKTEVEAMIEFAKLHVEAALKEASEKADCKMKNSIECTQEEKESGYRWMNFHIIPRRESIINAYSLDKIK